MATQIKNPYEQYTDIDGNPLEQGSVYIGVAGLNPELNPIQVYADETLSIAMTQPLKTVSGYIVHNGSPTNIFIGSNSYSITVRNKRNTLVFSSLNITSDVDTTGNSSLLCKTVADLTDPSGPILVTGINLDSDYIAAVANTGATITTSYYDTVGMVGGGVYAIKTLDQQRIDSGNPSWTANGFSDHFLFGSTLYVAVLQLESPKTIIPEQFGAKGFDGVTPGFDNGAVLTAIVNYAKTLGGATVRVNDHYFTTSQIDLRSQNNAAGLIKFQGIGKVRCGFYTNVDIELIKISSNTFFSDMGIIQLAAGHIGIAISTTLTNQMSRCNFERMNISNWMYGTWTRYSIWNNWTEVFFNDNLCGVKFSRNNDPYDPTDPEPTGGWNSGSNGWFQNVNSFTNCMFENGEFGFYGCPMNTTFTSCTAQRQRENVTGRIKPTPFPATGFYIQSGSNTFGTRRGWQNSFIQCYVEFTQLPFFIQNQRGCLLDGCFVQGGSQSTPYPTPVHVDGSIVRIRGMVGQDWFATRIIAENNSTVYGGTAGSVSGSDVGTVDSTSIWQRFPDSCDFFPRYSWVRPNGDAETVITIPITLVTNSAYDLHVSGIYNNSEGISGSYRISALTGGLTTVTQYVDANSTSARITVTVSGGNIIITHNSSLGYGNMRAVVTQLSDINYKVNELTPT